MFHETDTSQELVRALASSIQTGVTEKGQVLLLVAGGSATALYQPLRESLGVEVWKHVTITLTDERYGATGHADSNWPAVEQIFAGSGANLIPILSGKPREIEVMNWDVHLHSLTQGTYVIAFLGIGTDAHTSGIKPHSPASREATAWVIGYQGDDYDRITTAPAFFPHIDHAFVALSGPDKRAVYETLQTAGDVVEQPMQNIKMCKQFDVFYTIDN